MAQLEGSQPWVSATAMVVLVLVMAAGAVSHSAQITKSAEGTVPYRPHVHWLAMPFARCELVIRGVEVLGTARAYDRHMRHVFYEQGKGNSHAKDILWSIQKMSVVTSKNPCMNVLAQTLCHSWKSDKLDANEINKGDKEEQGLGWQRQQGRVDNGAARAEAGGHWHVQAGAARQGQVVHIWLRKWDEGPDTIQVLGTDGAALVLSEPTHFIYYTHPTPHDSQTPPTGWGPPHTYIQ
ncbi:hypothetical protein BJV74DRAFT_800145 [Russula compacta]|nr:hypothetical protein BJV74DRAFT_800145 [Russula compacta]